MSPQDQESITAIENQLSETAEKIGSVAEKNNQFTHGLALRLFKLKKPFELLTIAEFVEQLNLHVKNYNAVFGGES